MVNYRLPNGEIVAIVDDIAERMGAAADYTMADGAIVTATRVDPEPTLTVSPGAQQAIDAIAADISGRRVGGDPQAADLGARVLDRTICLALAIGRFGTRRKANINAVTVAADKHYLGLSKKLLASEHLTKVNATANAARNYLKETALPSFFKAGVYLVPMEMVTTIEAKMVAFKAEFEQHVDAFLAEYPTLIESMADPLGPLYNPTDYPSVGAVAATFSFEWRYVSFDVPGRLKAISAVMFEQEAAKAQAKLAMAAEEVQAALRVGLQELVSGLVEKLKPTDDGKRRRLSTASVEKLQTFLATFDLRNVTGDAELSALVDRAKAIVGGTDAEALREDKDLRASVLASFEALQGDISTLTVGRGARVFDLDDDDASDAA